MYPHLSKIIQIVSLQYPYLLENWLDTFTVATLASSGALLIAISMAIIATRFKLFENFLNPIVAVSQSFPLQALSPVIIMYLGVSVGSKVLIAFIIAFFPIYSICVTSLRGLPLNYERYIKLCHASYLKEVWYVRLPYSSGSIASAAKVGFTLAVLGSVVAEFIQPTTGIGKILLIAQSNYDLELIYICIGMLIIQGLMAYLPLTMLEKHLALKLRS